MWVSIQVSEYRSTLLFFFFSSPPPPPSLSNKYSKGWIHQSNNFPSLTSTIFLVLFWQNLLERQDRPWENPPLEGREVESGIRPSALAEEQYEACVDYSAKSALQALESRFQDLSKHLLRSAKFMNNKKSGQSPDGEIVWERESINIINKNTLVCERKHNCISPPPFCFWVVIKC